MKVIFFGLGSIGTRHAKIICDNYGYTVYAFRSKKTNIGNNLGIKEVYDWKSVDNIKPDVAFITNPTYLHIDIAIKCAKRGMDLFIEKPLGSNDHDLNKLLNIVRRKHISTYVAYVLRFHPAIEKIKEYLSRYHFLHMSIINSSYLPEWRPNQNHSLSYSLHNQFGGGVIFDLSHELDYADYLLDGIKKIKGQFSKRSNVTVDAEDYADILIQTKTGPANIHINFFSQIKERLIRIDFIEMSIVADLLNNTIKEYRKRKLIKKIVFGNSRVSPYEKQIQYFFSNIKKKRMMNDIREASHLFRKILKFKEEGCFVG